MITHNGENGAPFYYGHSHGSHVIPLKANGRFDAFLCLGYSYGTHYIVAQVYGYLQGYGMTAQAFITNPKHDF